MMTLPIPSSISLLTATALCYNLFRDATPDDIVQVPLMRDLHAQALGPGRRKRRAHFELRDERDVHNWLRRRGLTLFVPSAQAALRSLEEDGRLSEPPIGKHYSVYAMTPSDIYVALVRHDTPVGQAIVDGSVELPYDEDVQAEAIEIVGPMTRVVSSVILDTHAVIEFIRREGH